MTVAEPPGSIPLLFTRSSGRLMSLDILRGLAVVLMLFSGFLPKTLPNWVDHGYQPHFVADPIAGVWRSALDAGGNAVFLKRWKSFTWVDFVFPTFLFSMGTAIPIALSRLRERSVGTFPIVRGIIGRWLVLILFAVIIDNIVPPQTPTGNEETRKLLTLASFGVVFLFFVRWPAGTPRGVQFSVRWIAGIVIAIRIAGYAVRRADLGLTDAGQFYNWGRSDTIINVLAECYLVSALAWLITRRRPMLRLVMLLPLMLLAHYVAIDHNAYPDWLWMGGTAGSHTVSGDWPWTKVLFSTHDKAWTMAAIVQSPKLLLNLPHWIEALSKHDKATPWLRPATDFSPLWDFTWYKYLFAVVPGTVVGDWLYRWSRRASSSDETPMPPRRVGLSLGLAILICVGVFTGLRNYGFPIAGVGMNLGGPLRTPFLALTLTVPLLIAFGLVTMPCATGDRWIERRLFKAGAATLMLGLLLACVPIGKVTEPPTTLKHDVYAPAITPGAWRYFEGGISKGPPATLSYYATSVGLCCILLVALIRAFDGRRTLPPKLGPLAATGQNPLLAYYIGHAAFFAIMGLGLCAFVGHPFGPNIDSLDDLLGARWVTHPWAQALGDVVKTVLLIGFVWIVTRLKIFWRA